VGPGTSLSFVNDTGEVNFYWMYPALGGDLWSMQYDGPSRVVWDPHTMQIVGEAADTSCSPTTYAAVYDVVTFQEKRFIYGQGPKPCVARINADYTVDEAWTTDFTALTGGRFTWNFRYVKNGWGLMSVFYHDRFDVDFTIASS